MKAFLNILFWSAFVVACALALSAWIANGFCAERASAWPAFRAKILAATPYCAVCGQEHELNVHHVKPFHDAPELELAATNCMVLCEHCHWAVGHLGFDWKIAFDGIREWAGPPTLGEKIYRERERLREERLKEKAK